MLLFDYIYYLCCRLYRRSKRERNLDEWKVSGIFAVAGLSMLFLLGISFIVEEVFKIIYLSKIVIVVTFLLFLCIYAIRYKRIKNYDEIKDQILTFSDKKKKIYNISAGIFMVFSVLGTFLLALFLGPTFK